MTHQQEMLTKTSQSSRRYSFEDVDFLETQPDSNGIFHSTKDGSSLAVRTTVTLTKESPLVYKNDELLFAVDWFKTTPFKVYLYDQDHNLLPDRYCGAALVADAGAIVFGDVPVRNVRYASFVEWIGNIVGDKAVRVDGSTPMDPDYNPTLEQDVATKGYVDSILTLGAKVRNLIGSAEITISQDGNLETQTLRWPSLVKTNVTVFKEVPNKLQFTTSPIVIQSKDYSKQKLALYIDDQLITSSITLDKLHTLNNGVTCSVIEEKDLYEGAAFGEGIYTARKYQFTIANNLVEPGIHTVCIKILNYTMQGFKPGDEATPSYEFDVCAHKPKNAGLSFSIAHIPQALYDKTISGVKAITTAKSAVVKMAALITQEAYPLHLPLKRFALLRVLGDEYTFNTSDIVLDNGDMLITKDIEINLEKAKELNYDAETVSVPATLTFYDYHKAPYAVLTTNISARIDYDSDESSRVTTPDAEVRYPYGDYGDPFVEMKQESMKQFNGVYTSDRNDGTLMLVANESLESFSHVILSFDELVGNGQIQVKVEGETGWLSANDDYKLATIPTENGDGALVTKNCDSNNIYVTMSKVCYRSKVFVRFVGFKKISKLKITTK